MRRSHCLYRRIAQNQLRPQNQLRKQCVDPQRVAGQRDAKAHSKTHRAPYGRPKAPIGGRLGLWVLLRFRLTLAGRALRNHALFSVLALRSELILSNHAILYLTYASF